MKLLFFNLVILVAVACNPKSNATLNSSSSPATMAVATTATTPSHHIPHLGDWAYTIKNTQIGDLAGILKIFVKESKLMATMDGTGTVLALDNVVLTKDEFKAEGNYSGTFFKISSKIMDKTLSGDVMVDGSENLKINAVKN